MVKRKEQELEQMRKQLENRNVEIENLTTNLKKRNKEVNSQLTEQLDQTNKLRTKYELNARQS